MNGHAQLVAVSLGHAQQLQTRRQVNDEALAKWKRDATSGIDGDKDAAAAFPTASVAQSDGIDLRTALDPEVPSFDKYRDSWGKRRRKHVVSGYGAQAELQADLGWVATGK